MLPMSPSIEFVGLAGGEKGRATKASPSRNGLTGLVFVTARESQRLLGPRVFGAIQALEPIATQVCADCGGACCKRIACGFYLPELECCPIYTYRPARCRLYFCEKILESPLLTPSERQLLDGPAGDLSHYIQYNTELESGPQPPVRIGEGNWLAQLGLQEKVSAIRESLLQSRIDSRTAQSKLLGLIRRYRHKKRQPLRD